MNSVFWSNLFLTFESSPLISCTLHTYLFWIIWNFKAQIIRQRCTDEFDKCQNEAKLPPFVLHCTTKYWTECKGNCWCDARVWWNDESLHVSRMTQPFFKTQSHNNKQWASSISFQSEHDPNKISHTWNLELSFWWQLSNLICLLLFDFLKWEESTDIKIFKIELDS